MQSYTMAFVSNSERIAATVHDYAASQGVSMTVRLATMEDALPVARELLDSGVDVILGGGGTGKLLRQKLKRPVITISRSHLDILRALLEARTTANYIAITSYGGVTEGLDVLADLLRVRLRPVVFTSSKELAEGIASAVADGVGCVVGGGVCVDIAGGLRCRGIVVMPGPKVIQRALEEASNIAASQQQDRKQAAWLTGALDSLHEGIIGVSGSGDILFANAKAAEYLDSLPGNPADSRAGFLEAARIRSVLDTGRAVPDAIVTYRDRSFLANLRPVQVADSGQARVEGALAAFRPSAYLRNLGDKLRKHDKGRGFRAKYTFADLIGESEAMCRFREKAGRFAHTDANILIHGETGTGKELAAHAVHNAGPRAAQPFVAVNCAALPDTLLESELFGYEEGAFTGARKGGKEGLFLLADRGTIFLDEVADISPLLQVRLLRVLEAKEILQVGGGRVIPVSVRVISSSWKDLRREVREGRFRADLYYRLNTLSLTLPPLRGRPGDIERIAAELLRREGREPDAISTAGYRMLASHTWPGNVRELDAVLRRYALLHAGPGADDALLEELVAEAGGTPEDEGVRLPGGGNAVDGESLKCRMERYELAVIKQTLAETGNDRKTVARLLGISENSLWRKLKGR